MTPRRGAPARGPDEGNVASEVVVKHVASDVQPVVHPGEVEVPQMRRRLHEILAETGGMQIPLGRKMGDGANLRAADGATAAEFPEHVIREVK